MRKRMPALGALMAAMIGLVATRANGHTVNADSLNVRSGPGFGYAVIGTLARGTVVNTVSTSGAWTRIDSPKTGWVYSSYLSNTPHTGGGGTAFVWPSSGTLSATAWYPSGAVHSGSADIANGYWTGIGASRFGNAYASYEGGGCGYYVYINHASSYQTLYCHMVQWPSVGGGRAVGTNQHIGYVGSTGHSTGPHCHFAIRRWGARLVIPGIRIGQWVSRGAGVPGSYSGL